ncbi:ROK family transcriptional regulator [Streptacidiphilus pinicola]|uniref:ROK family transcriptional regulator n=1 Tax=Streptacidiphilus pinicola TaxID=2219663 RepID=A0A2X0IGC3_9ACTN|nr:ROK family protein [Streptacidiphilus pinicola]RAG82673.1 ROK family transcriptional regulator [Streptacidiphilus pinicola]
MPRESGDASFLRRLNQVAVLRGLHGTETATLAELARTARLSRATTETIMETLLREGQAEEFAPSATERLRGRPARRFAFRGAVGHVAGVGIGGARLTAMVADLRGRIVAREQVSAPPDLPSAGRLDAIAALVARACAGAGIAVADLTAVGVGTTGVIDGAGRVVKSVVLADWTGVPLQAELARRLAVPVLVENDMRLAVLAEHWRGAARDRADVMYLHTGSRIGLGLLLGGTPHRGSHAAAGELGGLSSSGWPGFQDVVAYARSVDPEVSRAPGRAALLALGRARAGDEEAGRAVDSFARALGRVLVGLVTPLDPELLVIGGSLAQAGEQVTRPIRDCLAEACLYPPDVVVSELGPDAVGLGAVRHALNEAERLLFAPSN